MDRNPAPSERWGHHPLFRLLIFLDTTGIQPFDASVEVDEESGVFLRPAHLLFSSSLSPAETSSATATLKGGVATTKFGEILQCVVAAFRENLFQLNSSRNESDDREVEKKEMARAILCALGVSDTGKEEGSSSSSFPSPASKQKSIFEFPASVSSMQEALDTHLSDAQRLHLIHLFCEGTANETKKISEKCTNRQKVEKRKEELVDAISPVSDTDRKGRSEEEVAKVFMKTNSCAARKRDLVPQKEISPSVMRAEEDTCGAEVLADLTPLSGLASQFCCHQSPSRCLVEQLLIDGLDKWLRSSLSVVEPPSSLSPPVESSLPPPLQRMVLACGGVLSPEVVLPLLSKKEGVSLLIEFLVNILFPLPITTEEMKEWDPTPSSPRRGRKGTNTSNKPLSPSDREEEKRADVACSSTTSFSNPTLIDWLLLAYHTNREEGEESGSQKEKGIKGEEGRKEEWKRTATGRSWKGEKAKSQYVKDENQEEITVVSSSEESKESNLEMDENPEMLEIRSTGRATPIKKRKIDTSNDIVQRVAKSDSLGLQGWTPPEDGDLYITSEMIGTFMNEHPEKLPRRLILEKRKKISDPHLTKWEIENHYTASELKSIIKELVREKETQESHPISSPLNSIQALPSKDWERVRKSTRKVEFIEFLMRLYKRETEVDISSKN